MDKKYNKVAVSGGFDPIHIGHIRLLRHAAKIAKWLVVILNNDNWLFLKKGYVFMPQEERKEILEAIRYVDEVILSKHSIDSTGMSICKELEELRPDAFLNGGDRVFDNIPEVATCKKIGCELIFNVGGEKIQSSSWLIEKLNQKEARNKIL